MEPNPVIIAATAKQTASLIFLHGLGDTGHGWASTIAAIRGPHVKVICPTASTIPVTLNAGFRMPSWFDLRTLDATAPEDEEGILRATTHIHGLISDEVKAGIPINRILVGGFSQGGALALHSALTYPEPLAGVMSLSCWLPRHAHFPDDVKAPFDLPIFQAHGDCDPVVPFKWGQMTASFLKTFMKNIEFTTYRGLSHSSSEAELKDMQTFIEKTLPAIFQAHGDCDPVVPFKWGQMTASFLKTFMKNIEFTTYRGLSHSSSEAELKDMQTFIEKTLPAVK